MTAAAAQRAEALDAAAIADALGGRRSGAGWAAPCPAHDDTTPSLTLSDGRDGRVLVRCHAGCGQAAVIAALRERGLWPQSTRRDVVPARSPDRAWPYTDASGVVVRRTARWDEPGGKVVRPQTPDGRGGWRLGDLRGPRPLYDLRALLARPKPPVLVVEGEPAADAAGAMLPDHVVTTSAGGAQGAAGSDWSPLRARDVTVWRDADRAGEGYAADAVLLTRGAGAATVRVVRLPPELPEGWDLADPLPEGWTAETVRELIAAAPAASETAEPSASATDDDSPPLDLWGSHLAGTPALNLGTLPAVLADFAADVSIRLGCDPALVAVPSLAVCAGALDDRHVIRPRQHDADWRTPARLWVVAAEDVGGGKSPALSAALAPLRALDATWADEDAPAQRRYALAMRVYARAVDQWVKGGGIGEPPNEPPRPPARRRVVEDFTTEALSDVLVDNPGGVLIGVDELTGLIGGMDAYRPAGTSKDQSLYLQLKVGGRRLIERVRRGKVVVPNWGASLVGGIQPARLRQIAPRIIDDGLLARCTVFFGAGRDAGVDRAANAKALARYARTIGALAALPIPGAAYTLAPGAHRHRECVVRIARAVAVLPTTAPGLAAHLGKWEVEFARLALTMHMVDAASNGEVPGLIIGEAVAEQTARLMVDYLLPHAAHLYGELLGQDHLTHARWIAGHILAHRLAKISARDIGRVYFGLRDDRHGQEDAMQTLTVAGWVSPMDAQPGRPPARWRVDPRVHELFGARAEAERQRRDTIRERIRRATETLAMDGDAT